MIKFGRLIKSLDQVQENPPRKKTTNKGYYLRAVEDVKSAGDSGIAKWDGLFDRFLAVLIV